MFRAKRNKQHIVRWHWCVVFDDVLRSLVTQNNTKEFICTFQSAFFIVLTRLIRRLYLCHSFQCWKLCWKLSDLWIHIRLLTKSLFGSSDFSAGRVSKPHLLPHVMEMAIVCFRVLRESSEYKSLRRVSEYLRVLGAISEYFRVLWKISEYFRVLWEVSEYFSVLWEGYEYLTVLWGIYEYFRVLWEISE
jgi:hypothetical protein